jgi:hypothetical protein
MENERFNRYDSHAPAVLMSRSSSSVRDGARDHSRAARAPTAGKSGRERIARAIKPAMKPATKPLTRQGKAESVEANRHDGSERVTRIAPSAMPRAPRVCGGRV